MRRGVTARRACACLGVSTAALYQRATEDKDALLRVRLREIWRPNMGYRMAHAVLAEEFAPLNVKRVYRIWKEEGLSLKKRYRKKRTGSAVAMPASAPNEIWCLDFCHDTCLNGSKLKVLAIIDEYTRECLALEVGTSFRSIRVQSVLSRLFSERGAPKFLRSDNGSEFIARSLAVFLSQYGATIRFIRPGSPWQNGYAESFVSTLRRDILDVEVFHNLMDAQLKLALYTRYYNEERPHSSLRYRPPAKVMSESQEIYS